MFMLIALVVFPSMFSKEMHSQHRQHWQFGWAYGIAWAAALVLFTAAILLIFDGEDEEEIFYKERNMLDEPDA